MKQLMMLMAAFSAGVAFATNYTWTGEGANYGATESKSWKDPANWGGKGYPHEYGDNAIVAKDADITVDETITLLHLTAKSGAQVTVRDDGASKIQFVAYHDEKGGKDTMGPSATDKGTRLALLAAVENRPDSGGQYTNRADPSVGGYGTLAFGGSWTNIDITGTTYLGGNRGCFEFASGCDFYARQLALGHHNSEGNTNETVYAVIREGAKVYSASTFNLGNNSKTPNAYIRQEGGEAVYGDLKLGYASGSFFEGWSTSNTYVMAGGTLTSSAILIGQKLSGAVFQSGGEIEGGQISFQNVTGFTSTLDVTGGTFGFTKFKANATYKKGGAVEDAVGNPDGVSISFKDCTIKNYGAYGNWIAFPVVLDGAITFDSTQGKVIGFTNPVIGDSFTPTMTAGTPVDLTFTRDYTQTAGTATYNELTVASGKTYTLAGGTLSVANIAFADSTSAFTLAGGTLAFTATATPSPVLQVTGPVTIDVAEGKTVTLNVEIAETGSIAQTGAGTLNLVYCGNTYLTSGTWTYSTLTVGAVNDTTLTIDGANVTATTLKFGNTGGDALGGGKLILKSGTLQFDSYAVGSAGRASLELKGGELVLPKDISAGNIDTTISGEVAINVASGKKLTFTVAPKFGDDANLVKKGAGAIAFAENLNIPWRGDFDIREGNIQLLGYTSLNHDPAAADASHKIKIADGAYFCIGRSSCMGQVSAWVDYEIEGDGFIFGYERNTIPVRSVTTNGVAITQPGAYYSCTIKTPAEAGTGWFRSSAGAYNSAVVIPYVWTGAGDGLTWEDADNWQDNVKPVTATPSSKIYSFADISTAERITYKDALTITGLVFMPTDGRKKFVFEGVNNNSVKFSSASYGIGTCVAPGCELVLKNCRPARSGTPIQRMFGGQITFEGNQNFGDALFGGCPYLGTAAIAQYATNATTHTYYFAGYAGTYSAMWFDAGTDFTFKRIYTGINSVPCICNLGVRNGGKLTLTDLYVSRISGDNTPNFLLDGADSSLTLTEGLYLGTRCPDTSDKRILTGGYFTLAGGTLTTPKIANELDSNYFYLKGGTLKLGAGGLQLSTSRKDKQVKDDSTTYQTKAAFYFQGGTLEATDDFASTQIVEVTEHTTSTLDTGAFDVTLCSNLVGKGTLVKEGAGALVLNGALAGAMTLKVAEGSLELGEAFSQTAALAALIAPSTGAIALEAGQNLNVTMFIVNGVAKSGTVSCGEGTVTVLGSGTDWLDAAKATQNYTKTFDADATLGSFSYENYVSDAGKLTITGESGVTLTLAADTVITVEPGDTLVFDLPVCIAGALSIRGGGNVEFTTNAEVTSADVKYTWVYDGTYLTVGAAWTRDNVIFLSSSETDARLCRLTITDDGYVNQDPMPISGNNGSKGFGGEMVLKDGGQFRYRATDAHFGETTKQIERIILEEGGIFTLPGNFPRRVSTHKDAVTEFIVRGGTVATDSYVSGPIIGGNVTVTLEGDLTIAPCAKTGGYPNAVAANFVGAGKIKVASNKAPVYLTGDLTGVTGIELTNGAKVILQDAANATATNCAVSLVTGTTLELAADTTVDTLTVNAVVKRGGRWYDSSNCDPLYGSGRLYATNPPAKGLVLIVK